GAPALSKVSPALSVGAPASFMLVPARFNTSEPLAPAALSKGGGVPPSPAFPGSVDEAVPVVPFPAFARPAAPCASLLGPPLLGRCVPPSRLLGESLPSALVWVGSGSKSFASSPQPTT